MWSLTGCNEIHNLIVKGIEDNSWMDKPYVTMNCIGYINPEVGLTNEFARHRYSCSVRAYDELVGYVLNELAIGNKILVIGHSDMALLDKKFRQRVTIAKQIYKADWLHYS